jgi:GTP cyclohydrolase I
MNNFEDIDDDVFTGKDHTPLREDAFEMTPDEKIKNTETLWRDYADLGNGYDRRFS